MPVQSSDIETALRGALAPQTVAVRDDSHLHAGHAGAREGRHFHVHVVSDRFTGLNRVARHRLVYDSLGPLMTSGIHALAIDAKAPREATGLPSTVSTAPSPAPAAPLAD